MVTTATRSGEKRKTALVLCKLNTAMTLWTNNVKRHGEQECFPVHPTRKRRQRIAFLSRQFYDPSLGLFISEDPDGYEGGINLYRYADNDPIDVRDPTGLVVIDPRPS